MKSTIRPPLRAYAIALTLVALWSTGCGCTPTAPVEAPATFDGVVAGQIVFHTMIVPRNTDSVDVDVRWTNPAVLLRVIQIDAACEPLTADTCRWVSDPSEGTPNSTARVINYYASHQGAEATGRVRVVIENLTPNVETTYTVVLAPQRHGTDC